SAPATSVPAPPAPCPSAPGEAVAAAPAAPGEVSAPSGAGAAPAGLPRCPGFHRRAAQQPITGQQIRERRLALGWTQAQLAQKVGLSRPFIALVEQGRRILNPDDLARVREALGI
ncbi:MAG: helix-turn-helix domain-containing protein, partial [Armatimonadetes bacterium]|nr:helix-turn-helix domain-containing protein [Armatimonadota bacterium]